MTEQRTPDVGLDRLLTDWLDADAAPRAPESLETAFVEGVASTRQRPAWATTERWISMETRAQLGVMPRVVIVLITIALLAIGAVGGYAIGSGLVNASDEGGTSGLTYSTQEGAVFRHPGEGAEEPVRLTSDDEWATMPFWSPDGKRFAYQAWAGPNGPITLMVRDSDGSNPIAVSELFARQPRGIKPNLHAWSLDSSTLVFAAKELLEVDGMAVCGLSVCGQQIWSAPADGSEPARVIGDPALHARGAPVFTPDGDSIIFAGSEGGDTGYGIYRMDADGANVERVGDLAGFGNSFDQLSVSPDGTMLATDGTTEVRGQSHDVYVLDLATGEDVRIDAVGLADDFQPYWSPDSSRIVFTSWAVEPQPVLYDVASGEVTRIDMSLYVLGWSPDGGSILGDRPAGILHMADVTDPTAPVTTPVEGVADAEWPTWQPRP